MRQTGIRQRRQGRGSLDIPFRVAGRNGDAFMEELAYQRWEGERIAEETFFYDPAQLIAREA